MPGPFNRAKRGLQAGGRKHASFYFPCQAATPMVPKPFTRTVCSLKGTPVFLPCKGVQIQTAYKRTTYPKNGRITAHSQLKEEKNEHIHTLHHHSDRQVQVKCPIRIDANQFCQVSALWLSVETQTWVTGIKQPR